MKNLNKYELLSEYQTAKQSSGFSTPSASWCLENNHSYFDDYDPDTYLKPITDYFTVEALEDGLQITFESTTGNLYYSLDNGSTWTSIAASLTRVAPAINKGDIIKFKGSLNTNDDKGLGFISSKNSKKYAVKGCLASLVYGDNYTISDYTHTNIFKKVFSTTTNQGSVGLIYAHELSFPATGLTEGCYCYMFYNCQNLITGPTKFNGIDTLPDYCFYFTFNGCRSMLVGPRISPTTVGKSACVSMFHNCYSLDDYTIPDILPAETLPESAYNSMFYGCSRITKAPKIMAKVLGKYSCSYMFCMCYKLKDVQNELYFTSIGYGACNSMFKGCESLVRAPRFSASTYDITACWSMFQDCTSLVDVQDELYGMNQGIYPDCFNGCTSLNKKIILPNPTSTWCYDGMFAGCKSLTSENLPEFKGNYNNVASSACTYMFAGCTSLTTIPDNFINARSISTSGCCGMFANCTSLTKAPSLSSVTTVSSRGCYGMFSGCTSLVTGPTKLATTVAENCYSYMFDGCASLERAPELPATTLVTMCYGRMFQGCTSLNYIKMMGTDQHSITGNYTPHWVDGVGSSGTFVKNSSATWENQFGVSSIPEGWTVETSS